MSKLSLDGVVPNPATVSCVTMADAATGAGTVSSITVVVTSADAVSCGICCSAVAAPSDGEPSRVGSATSVCVASDEDAGSAGVAARIAGASSCAAVGRCGGGSSSCADLLDTASAAAWLVVGLSALPFAVVSAALRAVASGWHITAPWLENAPRPHCEQDDEPIID